MMLQTPAKAYPVFNNNILWKGLRLNRKGCGPLWIRIPHYVSKSVPSGTNFLCVEIPAGRAHPGPNN